MNARALSISAAILLCLLSCTVMTGWIFHIPILIQIFPGYVGMVFNTALFFGFAGITILFANFFSAARYGLVLQALGLVIIIGGCLIVLQNIVNFPFPIDNWLIKPWLQDTNPIPGRMAPNTTAGFVLSGLIIFLLPYQNKRFVNLILPFFIFIILMIALIGLLVYSLKLEYVFSWYHFKRMAIHTAFGLIIMGIALWYLVIQAPQFKQLYEGREETKILLLSGAVLVTLTLITGLGSIAIITYTSFNLIQQSFKMAMFNKIDNFVNEINNIETVISKLIQNKNFQQTVPLALQNETPSVHQSLALIFADNDVAIKITSNRDGKILYEQGKFVSSPMRVPIKAKFNSVLLWDNGFWLRFNIPIFSHHQLVAQLLVESALPVINHFYTNYNTLGTTGENIICSYYQTKNQALCFPSRLNKTPFIINFTNANYIFPINYALDGKVGVDNMVDYRNQRVVAAYSPISSTGLGLVVKTDAREIYRSVNRLLLVIFPAGFLLIFVGLLLLRWQVVPLVRKVMSSEKEATKNKADLEHSEQRYEIAVNSSNTGLWDWQVDSNNFYASTLFKEMLGYRPDEFPDQLSNFLEHIHPDDSERIAALFNHANEQRNFNVEYRVKKKSGNYGWFQTIGQMVVDEFGKPKAMAGSLLDINERKRIETMKNEFISVVSHELRTPLTSIRGALCLLLSGTIENLSAKATHLLEIANNNCERLINLINDILDVEKIESGKIKLQIQPILISKTVKDAITTNQLYADKFSVNLQLVDDLPNVNVDADYERVMQVLNNLISNAIKFSPPHETIEIHIEKKNKMVGVFVSDKGKGVSEEFKSRIFQKFSQADSSSTRKGSGTGLGLNISKALIESMQGVIGFYNNPKEGATFFFELPISANRSEKINESAL